MPPEVPGTGFEEIRLLLSGMVKEPDCRFAAKKSYRDIWQAGSYREPDSEHSPSGG